MRFIGVIYLLFFSTSLFSQWDSSAGIIDPKNKNAKIEVTSGANSINAIDGDLYTYWESEAPLPDKYITREDLNIFHLKNRFSINEANKYATNAFDAITSTNSEIKSGFFEVKFSKPENIKVFSVKLNTPDSVVITIKTIGNTYTHTITSNENYMLKKIDMIDKEAVVMVSMKSASRFELFELAGLFHDPFEEIVFDMKRKSKIGWIGSRCYNGSGVKSIVVSGSDDKQSWNELTTLNPDATPYINHLISPEVEYRFIKVRFYLLPRDYQKAKLHEFDVYDKYGYYGEPNNAVPSSQNYSETFGINAIWGWGYNMQSSKLPDKKGPTMFADVAKLVRNYHGIDWDIKFPGDTPKYNNMMLDKGTSSIKWVNWHDEYQTWYDAGFKIDACLMFNNQYFPDTLWKDPIKESYDYGKSFSHFFILDHNLISMVEIGNEPWDYSKEIYRKLLQGMSSGIAEYGMNTIILPCATQAYSENNDLGNYISNFIDENNTQKITGINTHVYSYIFDYHGEKVAVNPEDPRSEVWSINNLKKFSSENLKDLPVYVTEYGYDSEGGGDDCTHSVCISETDQANYGVRMTLILYRLGVKQLYWYFYSNVDYNSIIHNRSGLVSSFSKGFAKKRLFNSFELLQTEIGNLYFHSIIVENENVYAYAFADEHQNIRAIIAWRPTTENHNHNEWVNFPLSQNVVDAFYLTSDKEFIKKEPTFVRTINNIKISLSGYPILLKVK